MVDREKLIKLLHEANHEFDIGCDPVKPYSHVVADYLIANGVTVQRWIPVAERLPEEDGEYLVWFGRNMFEHYAEVRHFAKDGETVDEYDLHNEKNVWYYYDSEWGYVACLNVTHWMPLPEPPKGELTSDYPER
ncbi:MAG: DUF551 domain-containing protein [Bacteroidaceae bacterium]|nr:DUF551 domain-containing protein [Bacteroidaceae bacterium]